MLHRIEIYCGSLAMPPLPSEARKSARAEVEVEVEVKSSSDDAESSPPAGHIECTSTSSSEALTTLHVLILLLGSKSAVVIHMMNTWKMS